MSLECRLKLNKEKEVSHTFLLGLLSRMQTVLFAIIKSTENMEPNRVRLPMYVCMCEEQYVTYLAKCRNLKELFKMWLDFTLSCNGFKYFFLALLISVLKESGDCPMSWQPCLHPFEAVPGRSAPSATWER
jgi:hypothetical protein